jgi:hypothetical protein
MVSRKKLEDIYRGEMKFTTELKVGAVFIIQGVEFVITNVGTKDGIFWLDFAPVERVTEEESDA